jgi:hypothetical protein
MHDLVRYLFEEDGGHHENAHERWFQCVDLELNPPNISFGAASLVQVDGLAQDIRNLA